MQIPFIQNLSKINIDERIKAVIVIVIVLIVFLEIFSREKVPDEFSDFVENISSQKILMNKIGGYETFEIKYNQLDLEKDSVSLTVVIYGKEKNITYSGYIKKLYNKWNLTTLRPEINNR